MPSALSFPSPLSSLFVAEALLEPVQGLHRREALGDAGIGLAPFPDGAEEFTVDFNASSLTSGTYFYRLESGKYVETKKMILLR